MKTKRFWIFCIGHVMLVFLLFGCFNAKKSYPEKNLFSLKVLRDEGLSPPNSGPVLKIQRFRVSPEFEAKGFVYRRGDLEYESDFYNEFLISSGPMIAEEVRKWLTQSGLFQLVISSSGLIEPTFYLEGVVNALYGDYRNDQRSSAVLEIQFFLVRNVSVRPVVVFTKTYHQETPLKENSPVSLAEGWNRALEYILTQFESDLKALPLYREARSSY